MRVNGFGVEECTEQALPSWMKTEYIEALPVAHTPWRRHFLSKTLRQLQGRIMTEQGLAAKENILGRLSPPIVVALFFALILAISLSHSILFLLIFQMGLVLLAYLCHFPLSSYALRVFGAVFFFSVIALFPALFSVVNKGTPLFVIYEKGALGGLPFLPDTLYITTEGARAFAYVILRSMNSIGLTAIVLWSMPFYKFMRALSKWGLPPFIIMLFDMTYRYLYLFMPLLESYILGRQSRMVGRESYKGALSWIGATIGDLARVTNQFGSLLYEALLSRGYDGEYRAPMPWAIGLGEIGAMVMTICIFAAAIGI